MAANAETLRRSPSPLLNSNPHTLFGPEARIKYVEQYPHVSSDEIAGVVTLFEEIYKDAPVRQFIGALMHGRLRALEKLAGGP